MQYIDTHAHINLPQFADDLLDVVARCAERGVGVINVGTHLASSRRAVELLGEYEDMWAIVGLHPINTGAVDPDEPDAVTEALFDYDAYRTLAQSDGVVGVGECGFDYVHRTEDTYAHQCEVFEAQITLANELKLPIMLHLRNAPADTRTRDAYDDALDILRAEARVPVNAHFYAGTVEQMDQFFNLPYGGTVSFTGVITFASAYEKLIKQAPLDLLHAETDCPYVAPVPHRGARCEPWMVEEVYKKIARIKKVGEEEVRQQLLKNARTFYKL